MTKSQKQKKLITNIVVTKELVHGYESLFEEVYRTETFTDSFQLRGYTFVARKEKNKIRVIEVTSGYLASGSMDVKNIADAINCLDDIFTKLESKSYKDIKWFIEHKSKIDFKRVLHTMPQTFNLQLPFIY